MVLVSELKVSPRVPVLLSIQVFDLLVASLNRLSILGSYVAVVLLLCFATLKLASELKSGKTKLREGLLVMAEANLTLLESPHCFEVRISKL